MQNKEVPNPFSKIKSSHSKTRSSVIDVNVEELLKEVKEDETMEKIYLLSAENGILEEIEKLYRLNPTLLESKGPDGKNALHLACSANHVTVAKFLIDQGIDVNQVDNNGWHALHFASEKGNLDIVNLLLHNPKTNAKAQTKDGDTILHFLARTRLTKEILNLIQEKGVNIDQKK